MNEGAKPTSSTKFFLGVDGGGTGTEACVIDAGGSPLGRGRGGPGNINYVPEDTFLASITTAVSGALAQANASLASTKCLDIRDLSGACLALAGAGGDNPAKIRRIAAPVLGTCPFLVVEDTHSALAAAHEGKDGIVIIAGTGSNCLGVKRGQYAFAGGYGALLGDEGSAYSIAVKGLRASLRSYDGRDGATSLTGHLMAASGAKTPRDFVDITLNLDRPSIAGFSRVVFEEAERGDETALMILWDEAFELAEMAKAVASRLGLESPVVAARGGCFKNPGYLLALEAALQEIMPGATLTVEARPASDGAAILARDHFLKGVG